MELMTFQELIEALSTIPDLIRQPTTSPTAAFLLLAVISTLLLVVVIALLLVITAPRQEQEQVAATPSEGGVSDTPKDTDTGEPFGAEGAVTPPPPIPEESLTLRQRSGRVAWRIATAMTWPVLLIVAVWIIGGATTASRAACESCHPDSPHVDSASIDPHVTVTCVSCHEAGGAISLVTATVPMRLRHFAAGQMESPAVELYGTPVSSVSCQGCHWRALEGVLLNEVRGVKVSHAEPLEAGAECVDCHALISGIVSAQTVGMSQCLRCHNGVDAAAGCEVCHAGDPAQAIRSTLATETAYARDQVPNPRCDGCHDQTAEGCDDCHGIRMPHEPEFMLYAHAREGAIDLWTTGGRVCGTCHHDASRSCSECHWRFPAHGASFRVSHGRGVSWENYGCSCHDNLAYRPGRNFCQICHETRPAGALP